MPVGAKNLIRISLIDRRRRPREPYRIRLEEDRALFIYLRLAYRFLRSAVRPRCDVALENLALRQQLLVLACSSRRPHLQPRNGAPVRAGPPDAGQLRARPVLRGPNHAREWMAS